MTKRDSDFLSDDVFRPLSEAEIQEIDDNDRKEFAFFCEPLLKGVTEWSHRMEIIAMARLEWFSEWDERQAIREHCLKLDREASPKTDDEP